LYRGDVVSWLAINSLVVGRTSGEERRGVTQCSFRNTVPAHTSVFHDDKHLQELSLRDDDDSKG